MIYNIFVHQLIAVDDRHQKERKHSSWAVENGGFANPNPESLQESQDPKEDQRLDLRLSL